MNDGRSIHFDRCESAVRNVNDAPNTETAKIVSNIPINSEVYQDIKAVKKNKKIKRKRDREPSRIPLQRVLWLLNKRSRGSLGRVMVA